MSSNSKLIAETQLGGHSDQTGAFDMPVGTTAQRPSSPSSGFTRMNTDTSTMEMYNGTQWVTVGGTDMKVYAISPTTVTTAGTTVTITGEGFENGATVHFVSAATGTSTAAATVSFVSANSLTVTTPTLAVDGEPWSVKVTNPDGISAAIESILDAGGSPTWTTAAGQIGSDTIQSGAFSTTVAATDPDGQSVSYSESGTTVLTGSGSNELGFTLNSSSGAITGTMPSLSSDTTFNFTLAASDGVNSTTRAFNIVGSAGTPTVNYLYGGVVTTDYSVHGTYGISGGMANGYRTSGSTNYSNTSRTAYTSGYSGSASGAGSIPSDEIHTQDGNEDGYFYFHCGGSAATGVGITVGWYTGRMYIPADHDRLRIELWSNSFASNQISTGGGLTFTFHSSINSSAYGFNGTTYTAHSANSFTDGLNKATGNRFSDWDISSNVSTINGAAHYLTFYADGGQYSDSRHSVYRVASYNSAVGL